MKILNLNNVSSDIHSIVSNSSELVNKIGIFGSLARGNYNADSDIDILIEYASTPDFQFERFTRFCELCNKINETLINIYGREVDLIHFENDPLNHLNDIAVKDEVIWL
ncbi:MAG: nucleotidyltransferase domain-containing protein [Oscillospiraceae bacterium]|nr:nucleotidyltransferase domain-containing protein [Oscillospiraceae bacterium]